MGEHQESLISVEDTDIEFEHFEIRQGDRAMNSGARMVTSRGVTLPVLWNME